MATVYRSHRLLIADRMAASDADRKWLARAKFAKTANGFWLAWRADDPTHVAVLEPSQPGAKPCVWLDSTDGTDTIEKWAAYLETGEYEAQPPRALNLWIKDSATGEWK